MLYYEAYFNKKTALKREKSIKSSWKLRAALKKRLSDQ